MNKHLLEKKILEDIPTDIRIGKTYIKISNANIIKITREYLTNFLINICRPFLDLNSLVKKQKIQERKNWTCKFCGMVESNVVSFAVHISEHYTMQMRKICEYCKLPFMSHKVIFFQV